MKRKIKCLEKRAFDLRSKAERYLVMRYRKTGRPGSIYECPKCLDFHVTKAYDNRSPELVKRCRDARIQLICPGRKSTKKIMKENRRLMQYHLYLSKKR